MSKTNNITKGALFTALSILFIYLSSIMPTNRLALLVLSTFIIISSIITIGINTSILVFISTSLLSFFLVSSKGIAVLYIVFFGIYGFVKYYIEKIRILFLEIFIKLLFFNSVAVILFQLYEKLFVGIIDFSKIKISIYFVIILLQIGFIVYDYVLTLFVTYFNNNLLHRFSK